MLVDKQSELMSDLLFTVHQHGGDDVTWKPPIVPHFSSGIAERAKRERELKSPPREKGTRGGGRELSPRRVSPFLVWGDFHSRSRFAPLLSLMKNGGTTRSLAKQRRSTPSVDELKIFLFYKSFDHSFWCIWHWQWRTEEKQYYRLLSIVVDNIVSVE